MIFETQIYVFYAREPGDMPYLFDKLFHLYVYDGRSLILHAHTRMYARRTMVRARGSYSTVGAGRVQ